MLGNIGNGEFLVLHQKYSFESSCDIERDVSEAIEEIAKEAGKDYQDNEWQGTIQVTIKYIPDSCLPK